MRGDDKFSQNFSLPSSTPASDELWFGEVEEGHYNQSLFCNVERTIRYHHCARRSSAALPVVIRRRFARRLNHDSPGRHHKYHSLPDSLARRRAAAGRRHDSRQMPALLSWIPVAYIILVRCEGLQGACFWRETRRSSKTVTSTGYGSLPQKPQILCCPSLA